MVVKLQEGIDKRRHSNFVKYAFWNVLNIWFFILMLYGR